MTKRAWVLLAVGWTVGILAACTIPGSNIPDTGWDLFEYDKFAHFGLFAGYGWLWMNALRAKLSLRNAIVIGTGSAYAVLTELYQGLLPWERIPDPLDALANVLGLLTAVVVYNIRYKKG